MSWLCIPDQPPAIAVELLDEAGILCLKHCSDLEQNGENSLETFLINSFKSLHGALCEEQKESLSTVVAAVFLPYSEGRGCWGWATAWEDLREYNAKGKCHLFWPNQNVTLTNYE